MAKYTWWEQKQIEKFPDLSPKEAIKAGKELMASYSKGNKGNRNPWLKDNPEAARAIRNGTYKKEG